MLEIVFPTKLLKPQKPLLWKGAYKFILSLAKKCLRILFRSQIYVIGAGASGFICSSVDSSP